MNQPSKVFLLKDNFCYLILTLRQKRFSIFWWLEIVLDLTRTTRVIELSILLHQKAFSKEFKHLVSRRFLLGNVNITENYNYSLRIVLGKKVSYYSLRSVKNGRKEQSQNGKNAN